MSHTICWDAEASVPMLGVGDSKSLAGVVNVVGEQCDGVELNGVSCSDFGYDVGLLACDGSCRFDMNTCGECISIAGTCWFHGDANQNCDEVCAGVGLVYAEATNTYAGSDGTNGNCFEVLEASGAGVGAVADLACAPGFGNGVLHARPRSQKVRYTHNHRRCHHDRRSAARVCM